MKSMAQEKNIGGFEDLGENYMSNNFADKVFVFMVEDAEKI